MSDGDGVDLRLRIRQLEEERDNLRAVVMRARDDLMHDRPKTDILGYLRNAVGRALGGERWTKQEIVEAMKQWNEEYGKPPSAASWTPTLLRDRGREDELAWFLSGTWPGSQTVRRHFGSFTTALVEAGFPPSPMGRPVGLDKDRIDDGLPQWTAWARLGGWRQRLGLSVAELSRRTKIGYNHLIALERGESINPTARVLLALADGLEIPPAALIGDGDGLRGDVLTAVGTIFREYDKDPERFEQEAQEKGITVDQVLVDAIRFALAQLTWQWSEDET